MRPGQSCWCPSLALRRRKVSPFADGPSFTPFFSARLLSFTAEKERSWSPPDPFLSSVISRTLFTKFRPPRPRSLCAAATRKPPSGCRGGYLALHLAPNWFSGKKRNEGNASGRRLRVMRRTRKKKDPSRRTIRGRTRRAGPKGREGEILLSFRAMSVPSAPFCAHMLGAIHAYLTR